MARAATPEEVLAALVQMNVPLPPLNKLREDYTVSFRGQLVMKISGLTKRNRCQ